MKILQHGKHYKGSCSICGCVFEACRKEVKTIGTIARGVRFQADCPECGEPVRVELKDEPTTKP